MVAADETEVVAATGAEGGKMVTSASTVDMGRAGLESGTTATRGGGEGREDNVTDSMIPRCGNQFAGVLQACWAATVAAAATAATLVCPPRAAELRRPGRTGPALGG